MIQTNASQYFFAYGDQDGREKIILGDSSGSHYTFLFNRERRILDFHYTIEDVNGKKVYKPKFKMRFFTFYRIMAGLLPKYKLLFQQLWLTSRINLGKLKRHKCYLIPMQIQQDKVSNFIKQKGKKKFRLKKEIHVAHIQELIMYLEDFPEKKTEMDFYSVITEKSKARKQVGLIFRHPTDKRKTSFYFVSHKKLILFHKEV